MNGDACQGGGGGGGGGGGTRPRGPPLRGSVSLGLSVLSGKEDEEQPDGETVSALFGHGQPI